MADKKTKPYIPPPPGSGGGMGPVGSVGLGMSPVERVQYIQELQKASPISRIAGALQNVKMEGFGLVGDFFNKGAAIAKGVGDAYAQIRNSPQSINQHISGLTENVRGLERLRHEFDPQANTDLLETQQTALHKGLFVDSDWTPKSKGQVE